MTLTTFGTKIDLRPLAARERQPLVSNTFRSLGAGEAVELIADADTTPLQQQLRADWPGRFAWDALQSGPDVWRVRIVKLGGHGASGCCGGCGGGH